MTSRGVVEAMRTCFEEDEPEKDLDKAHVVISPIDKADIKREMSAQGPEEPAGDGLQVGMTLAAFEYDESLEQYVQMYDSGVAGLSALRPSLSDYDLPLHLRLPPLRRQRRIVDSPPASPQPSQPPLPQPSQKHSPAPLLSPTSAPSNAVQNCVSGAIRAVLAAAPRPAPPETQTAAAYIAPTEGMVVRTESLIPGRGMAVGGVIKSTKKILGHLLRRLLLGVFQGQ